MTQGFKLRYNRQVNQGPIRAYDASNVYGPMKLDWLQQGPAGAPFIRGMCQLDGLKDHNTQNKSDWVNQQKGFDISR